MKIIDFIKQHGKTDLLANMMVYPVKSRGMDGETVMWNFNAVDGKKGLPFAIYDKEEVIKLAKEHLESELGNINFLK